MKRAGYTKIIRPKDKTPYQAFVSGVVKPMYDALKLLNKLMNKQTNPQLLTKVAATMWNQTILLPAMVYVYGENVLKVDESEWKKLRNKAEVKASILNYVQFYLGDVKRLFDFIPLFIEVSTKSGNPIPENFVQWLPRLVKARLLDVKPPSINDKAGWQHIDEEFARRFAV